MSAKILDTAKPIVSQISENQSRAITSWFLSTCRQLYVYHLQEPYFYYSKPNCSMLKFTTIPNSAHTVKYPLKSLIRNNVNFNLDKMEIFCPRNLLIQKVGKEMRGMHVKVESERGRKFGKFYSCIFFICLNLIVVKNGTHSLTNLSLLMNDFYV